MPPERRHAVPRARVTSGGDIWGPDVFAFLDSVLRGHTDADVDRAAVQAVVDHWRQMWDHFDAS